ncbi:MAG: hypothetical protein ABI612_04900 [Betaproteobacteria bacterium]
MQTSNDIAAQKSLGSRKLRIGLLVDAVSGSKYVYELAQWASSQNNLVFSHLLVLHPPVRSDALEGGEHGSSGLAKRLLGVVVAVENLLIRQIPIHCDHLADFDLGPLVQNQIAIEPVLLGPGLGFGLSESDIEKIKSSRLDLLIHCGSGTPRGEMLNAARLGVIAFHHAGHAVEGGAPAGFWEAFHRAEQTAFVLSTSSESTEPGRVLKAGAFATQFFYLLNQAHLCKKANEHLKALLAATAALGTLPESNPQTCAPSLQQGMPNGHELIMYVCKIAWRIAVKVGRRTINIRARWRLSFIHAGWQDSLRCPRTAVANPRGRFLADPFLYTQDGKTYCFAEDYVYRTGRGHISAFEVRSESVAALGACLSEPFHLSFPYLFRYGGQLYMCPETNESDQIRVYRCKVFPLQWELAAVLMDGLSAADSMLFEHDGRWWMFTNIDPARIGDHCAELYIFSADSPLAGEWTPHPRNPIYIDSQMARNAGLFRHDGKLYRAAQRQGFDLYGKGFSIFEVTALTPTHYAERQVASIEADATRGMKGTHHITSNGSTTMIDELSFSFVR